VRGLTCDYIHDSQTRQLANSRARHEARASSIASTSGYQKPDLSLSKPDPFHPPSHVLDPPELVCNINCGIPLDNLVQDTELDEFENSSSSGDTISTLDPISQYLLETDVYSYKLLSSAPRVFSPKSIGSHKSSLQRSYVLCALRSYPQIMLGGQSPPFIHTQSLFDDFGDLQLRNNSTPGPLAVCDELLRMHAMKNEDNVLQIWKAIRMEQERLLIEVCCSDSFNPKVQH
jgi:hypothetical protein